MSLSKLKGKKGTSLIKLLLVVLALKSVFIFLKMSLKTTFFIFKDCSAGNNKACSYFA